MLKDWFSPIGILNIAAGIYDLSVGLICLHRARWAWALIDFGLAAFSAFVVISLKKIRERSRNMRAARAAIEAQREMWRNMSETEQHDVHKKALLNLEKVMKALNAVWHKPFVSVKIKASPDFSFLVTADHIYQYTCDLVFIKSTCYVSFSAMPSPERIASALLQLKRDPKIFDKWARKDCYYV